MIMSELDIPLWVLTGALVVMTFFVWRATDKVAKSTDAVGRASKEVGEYPVMPRFEVTKHTKQTLENESYDNYNFHFVNVGLGDGYNIQVEMKSDEMSSDLPPPFTLRKDNFVTLQKSVKKGHKIVQFFVKFESVYGTEYSRKILYEISDDKEDKFRIIKI